MYMYIYIYVYIYICIKCIRIGLVDFYGISTVVGYLMPDPVYTYISNINDLVGLGFMAYQLLLVNQYQFIFIEYIIYI